MRLCSLDDCDEIHYAKSFCQKHWTRWRRWGDPLAIGKSGRPAPADDLERFMVKVRKTRTCWRWTGTTTRKGYAQFWDRGSRKMVQAHRWIYERLVGEIPGGLVIDHVRERGCRFRDCVNPAHLEPVTEWENVRRGNGPTAKNARKTRCKRGHPLVDLPGGRRGCRTCMRASQNAYDRRQREAARSARAG